MELDSSNRWVRRDPQQLNRVTNALRLAAALVRGYRAGLRHAPVQIADVGARGGLSRAWQVLWRAGMIRPIFVEPEPHEAQRLREMYPNAKIMQSALGESVETKTLYVTQQPGCSSLLRPNVSARAPRGFKAMCEVVNEVEVEVKPAQTVFSSEGLVPDVLKLDVQGMELSILRGLGSMLADIDVVEVEVSFIPTYDNQPLIQEVVDFMFDSGFGLIHIAAFGVAGTGCAIQANALFGNRRKPGHRQAVIEDMALKAAGGAYAP